MSSQWGFHKLPSTHGSPQLAVSIEPSKLQCARHYEHPQGATVSSTIHVYEKNKLLGIPLEVRQYIWEQVALIDNIDRAQWVNRQRCEFADLLLSCRQVYHELSMLWRRFEVPWNRLQKFLTDVPNLNPVNIKQFRSLSFEIRLDAHPGYISALTDVLHKCQPFLRELRLHFVGPDRYGTKIYTHGCGNLENERSERKLPIDGQEFNKLLGLWQRIMLLRRLEVLVISNANLQLYQTMFLENKPYLGYLHLSTDPRATIHQQHHISDLGRLIDQPKKDEYPPVKALCIHANATISSVQIAAKLGATLEHLTWVVPDPSLGSSGMRIPWYEYTAHLMNALYLRAPNLQTLRICIGGAGLYEGHHEYGHVIGSIKTVLPMLRRLRQFELHMKSKSDYFGKELVQACPYSLERLHLSDRIIHPYDLMAVLWNRFGDALFSHSRFERRIFDHLQADFDIRKTTNPVYDNINQGDTLERKVSWPICLDPVCYNDQDMDIESSSGSPAWDGNIVWRTPEQGRQEFLEGLVGEDPDRIDFIPVRTGCLRFIHYEFDNTSLPLLQGSHLTASQILLYINGRLLDRARHKHLIRLDPGFNIPFKMNDVTSTDEVSTEETATRSSHLEYSVLLYQLYEIESSRPRNLADALEELDSSPLTDDNQYFGSELDAQRVFEQEPAAKHDDLEPLTRVVLEDVYVDGKCHWSCPEAEMPNMDEREQA